MHDVTRVRRWRADDGLTMIELMIAIIVLGIILAGFGSVIMGSLRAIAMSEREVRATAIGQQAIEELQSVVWDAAGLYTDEVTAAPAAWKARLDDPSASTPTIDGDEVILLANPATAAERLVQVPEPEQAIAQGNVEYVVHRYVTWVDSTGDGTPESKRFTAIVSWSDVTGEVRSLRADGDRIATESEVPSNSGGARVLSMWASPDPAELDPVTALNVPDITVTVLLNQGITAVPDLRLFTLKDVDDEEEPFVERTLTLDGTETDTNGGLTRWTVTIPAGTWRFVNGPIDLLFTGVDIHGVPLEAYGSLQLRSGPFDGPAPRPTSDASVGDPTFPAPPPTTTETTQPTPPLVDIISVTVNGPICVDGSTWRLTKPLEVTVTTNNMPGPDGTVNVTYEHWTDTNNNDTAIVTDSAPHQLGDVYKHTLPVGSATRLFRPQGNEKVSFTATASRPDTSNAALTSSPVAVSGSC